MEERKGSLEKERRMDERKGVQEKENEEKVEGRRLLNSLNSLINEDNCLRLALTNQVNYLFSKNINFLLKTNLFYIDKILLKTFCRV